MHGTRHWLNCIREPGRWILRLWVVMVLGCGGVDVNLPELQGNNGAGSDASGSGSDSGSGSGSGTGTGSGGGGGSTTDPNTTGGTDSCTDTWNNWARSFFSNNCGPSCHGNYITQQGVVSDTLLTATYPAGPIQTRIENNPGLNTMPLNGTLTDSDKSRLLAWITCGAK